LKRIGKKQKNKKKKRISFNKKKLKKELKKNKRMCEFSLKYILNACLQGKFTVLIFFKFLLLFCPKVIICLSSNSYEKSFIKKMFEEKI
jgi:hypothetical protein